MCKTVGELGITGSADRTACSAELRTVKCESTLACMASISCRCTSSKACMLRLFRLDSNTT
eukprot:1656600-Amphidinium_carterae.1